MEDGTSAGHDCMEAMLAAGRGVRVGLALGATIRDRFANMGELLSRIQFDLFADYHQFYLWDLDDPGNAGMDWTQADVDARAKVGHKLLVLCPHRNTLVPVALELHSAEPEVSLEEWDHVVEAPLHIASGRMEVATCPCGWIGAFPVEPGPQRVRFSSAGGDTLSFDGLEGDDYYLVQVWPADPRPLEVLKQGPSR